MPPPPMGTDTLSGVSQGLLTSAQLRGGAAQRRRAGSVRFSTSCHRQDRAQPNHPPRRSEAGLTGRPLNKAALGGGCLEGLCGADVKSESEVDSRGHPAGVDPTSGVGRHISGSRRANVLVGALRSRRKRPFL